MPNGKTGDHPLTDLLVHGLHPFPPDMELMIRRLYDVRPDILRELGSDPFDWQIGRNVDKGRERLRDLLRQQGIDPDTLKR